MTTDTFKLALTMTPITCCHEGCGLVFAVPRWWEEKRREDHTWWYCPNGHSQHFSVQSDKERAEAAAKRAQELLEQERRKVDDIRQPREGLPGQSTSRRGIQPQDAAGAGQAGPAAAAPRTRERNAMKKKPAKRKAKPDVLGVWDNPRIFTFTNKPAKPPRKAKRRRGQ